MKKHDLILLWRKRISNGSIAGTTLRNQGKGIVQCARAYLIKLDLSELHFIKDAEQFDIWLDQKTAKLQTEMRRLLKRETGNDVFWGTARKSLNLYLLLRFRPKFALSLVIFSICDVPNFGRKLRKS